MPKMIAVATVPITAYTDKNFDKNATNRIKKKPGRIVFKFKSISFNYEILPHFKFAGTAISNLLG